MFGTLSKFNMKTNEHEFVIFGYGTSITGSNKENPSKKDIELFETEKSKSSLPVLKKMFYISGYDGKWYRTNVIKSVSKLDFDSASFRTASDSFYQWTVYNDDTDKARDLNNDKLPFKITKFSDDDYTDNVDDDYIDSLY